MVESDHSCDHAGRQVRELHAGNPQAVTAARLVHQQVQRVANGMIRVARMRSVMTMRFVMMRVGFARIRM